MSIPNKRGWPKGIQRKKIVKVRELKTDPFQTYPHTIAQRTSYEQAFADWPADMQVADEDLIQRAQNGEVSACHVDHCSPDLSPEDELYARVRCADPCPTGAKSIEKLRAETEEKENTMPRKQRGSVVRTRGKWGAQWRDENGIRQFRGSFPSEEDAREWVTKKVEEVEMLRLAKTRRKTVLTLVWNEDVEEDSVIQTSREIAALISRAKRIEAVNMKVIKPAEIDNQTSRELLTASELGRRGGLKGGPARAASMTPAQRSAASKKASQARWDNQPKWDKDTIVSAFKEFYELHSRPPTRTDFGRAGKWPAKNTVLRHFESWDDALEAAGLEKGPRRRRNGDMNTSVLDALYKQTVLGSGS